MYRVNETGFEGFIKIPFIKIPLKADTCFLYIRRLFRDWLVFD